LVVRGDEDFMADEPTGSKRKRRVKNPETFRERALKANETEGKAKRPAAVKRAGSSMAKPAAAPFKRVGRSKPVRLIGKVLVPSYLRSSWAELKLVTWPSWKQSRQLTFAVLIFAVVFGAVIAGVDYGLDKIFKNLLLK